MFARAATHRGPYKNGPGDINVPVSIGGLVITPGDIVVGDDDGIVAFPQAIAATLLQAVRSQEKKEAEAPRDPTKAVIPEFTESRLGLNADRRSARSHLKSGRSIAADAIASLRSADLSFNPCATVLDEEALREPGSGMAFCSCVS